MRFNNKGNLCYINSAVQALFNIHSFKKDLADWKCEKNWGKEIISVFKQEMASARPGVNSYDLFEFRKSFKAEENFEDTSKKVDKKHEKKHEKKSNSSKFLTTLLSSIHTRSDCNPQKLCPSCKNFKIQGQLKVEEKIKDKIEFKKRSLNENQFNIVQHVFANNVPIKESNDILSYYESVILHYILDKPPQILFIQLLGTIQNNKIKKESILKYITENETIQYRSDDGTNYIYKLKSIILFGDKHYKSLLYSRTYNS